MGQWVTVSWLRGGWKILGAMGHIIGVKEVVWENSGALGDSVVVTL